MRYGKTSTLHLQSIKKLCDYSVYCDDAKFWNQTVTASIMVLKIFMIGITYS
jgi:hypothetical protein